MATGSRRCATSTLTAVSSNWWGTSRRWPSWSRPLPSGRYAAFALHLEMSRQNPAGGRDDLAGITHLVWPEAAMPFLPLDRPEAIAQIGALLPAQTYLVAGALRPDDTLDGRLVPEGMRDGSPVLRSFVEFVYLDGFAQASALARKGGFRRLAQERKARRTTRDVLHLDRAPARPEDLPVPEVPPSLGLSIADRDVLGEQGIISLVSVITGKDNLGLIAGDGWVADSLWRFEGGGSGATFWATRWLTEEDAKDFAYAIERTLMSRFPSEPPLDDAERGGRVLRRPESTYRIQKRGLEVQVAVAPPSIDAKLGAAEKKKGPTPPAKSVKRLK